MWIITNKDGYILCSNNNGYYLLNPDPKLYGITENCVILFKEEYIQQILKSVSSYFHGGLFIKKLIPVDWE